MEIINEYLQYIFVQEDFKTVFNKLSNKSKFKNLKRSLKTKDPKNIKNAIPNVNISTLTNISKKISGFSSEFSKNHRKIKGKTKTKIEPVLSIAHTLMKIDRNIVSKLGGDVTILDKILDKFSNVLLRFGKLGGTLIVLEKYIIPLISDYLLKRFNVISLELDFSKHVLGKFTPKIIVPVIIILVLGFIIKAYLFLKANMEKPDEEDEKIGNYEKKEPEYTLDDLK